MIRSILTSSFKTPPARSLIKPHSRFIHPSPPPFIPRSNVIPSLLRSRKQTRSPPFFTTSRLSPSNSSAFSTSSILKGIRPYYGQSNRNTPLHKFKAKIESFDNLHYYLIAANVLVYLAWNYYESVAVRFRDARGLRFMSQNFTVSMRNLREGRIWTLATSCFSHEGTGHLFMNCLGLYFIAPAVVGFIGNVGFLSLYLFSGVAANVFALGFNQLVRPNPVYSSHGASGAVYGVLSFFAAANPTATFLIFFVIPAPAWACLSGLFLWDAYSALNSRGGTTDSAGHVGGIMAGLLFFAKKIGRF